MGGGDLALVFPGQGSQVVGMGRDLCDGSPAAREVFALADAALDWPLSQRCFEGPDEVLRDTAISQPAIVTVSIAALAALREHLGFRREPLPVVFTAGHSVGQYAALVAAEVLDFAEAIRLVGERGRLMKAAGAEREGGMVAVLGLDEVSVEQICREAQSEGVVCAANYNMPGQTVISGDRRALAQATKLAQARGAKRVVPLAVTVANHSPLMATAAEHFAELIARLPLRPARVPIVANSSARPLTAPEEIRAELREHMISSVRWTESIATMEAAGVTRFWELGPGQVLAGLIKRSAPGATTRSIGSLTEVVAADSQK